MDVISSRSVPVQILGFLAYLLVTPFLFIMGGVPGFLMGPPLAELSGLAPEMLSDKASLLGNLIERKQRL